MNSPYIFSVPTTVQSAPFYNNGSRNAPNRRKSDGRLKAPPMLERRVIAWDMEGMNLSGDGKPQHPVVFGCSAEPQNVLVDKRLTTESMLENIIDVGRRNPHAIHVGYGFRYDGNMLLQGLSTGLIERLWRMGEARFGSWYIRWVPGKLFQLSKRDADWSRANGTTKARKCSVTIYDYSSFFGGLKFIEAAEQILQGDLSEDDKHVIEYGKGERGNNTWEDLESVLFYWTREIELVERVFTKFRDVMYRAGFPLQQWYGPGALANFINASRKIRPKLAAAQVTSGALPLDVHEASKRAFGGGRFELFQAGRVVGPIHAVDINSAYPYALTLIPSLHPDEGEWRHVDSPTSISRFGFYRISYFAENASPFEYRPMPLFWRDYRGLISFPNRLHGWYASPEANMVQGMPGVTVHEGWEWISNESEFPWRFLQEMYDTRQRLGKKNLLSLPFKLGPNSLYGKYAQTVGWDRKKKLPPKSHALPVAAWITSFTRAKLWSIMRQIPDRIVAVETDSVFFTGNPTDIQISIGSKLGEWSHAEYDEIMYIQSGMYHTKKEGEWTGTKSRGMAGAEFPQQIAASYLQSLQPGEPWSPLELHTKPRFIGAGAALNSAAPFKVQHCAWIPQKREMTLGETGKRRHVASACKACKEGMTPYDSPHRLAIGTLSDGEILSAQRRLPWEQSHTTEVEEIRIMDAVESELIG